MKGCDTLIMGATTPQKKDQLQQQKDCLFEILNPEINSTAYFKSMVQSKDRDNFLEQLAFFMRDEQRVQLFFAEAGIHPLHEIVKAGWHTGLSYLLKRGKYDINMKTKGDENPLLHIALANRRMGSGEKNEKINVGRQKCCELLLDYGADPFVENAKKMTPFRKALLFCTSPPLICKLFEAIKTDEQQEKALKECKEILKSTYDSVKRDRLLGLKDQLKKKLGKQKKRKRENVDHDHASLSHKRLKIVDTREKETLVAHLKKMIEPKPVNKIIEPTLNNKRERNRPRAADYFDENPDIRVNS